MLYYNSKFAAGPCRKMSQSGALKKGDKGQKKYNTNR